MADSNITKKALADSLKNLMERTDFSKINVADICNGCGMNRKSFYYHFKDKDDLVNWIFDVEFFAVMSIDRTNDSWELLEVLCNYFYENRRFYCSALQISGQNSFSEHFVELMQPIIEARIKSMIGIDNGVRFYVDFCIDAYMGALKRWLTDKNCMQPDEFLEKLRNCLHIMAVRDQKFGKKK